MDDQQINDILRQIGELLDDESAAARLSLETHAMLEKLRSVLRVWSELEPEQQDLAMVSVFEAFRTAQQQLH